MLSLHGKHGVVISRMPVMQNGLGGLMARHFPEFELSYCRSLQELTLLQLRARTSLLPIFQANTETLGVRLKSITVY